MLIKGWCIPISNTFRKEIINKKFNKITGELLGDAKSEYENAQKEQTDAFFTNLLNDPKLLLIIDKIEQ